MNPKKLKRKWLIAAGLVLLFSLIFAGLPSSSVRLTLIQDGAPLANAVVEDFNLGPLEFDSTGTHTFRNPVHHQLLLRFPGREDLLFFEIPARGHVTMSLFEKGRVAITNHEVRYFFGILKTGSSSTMVMYKEEEVQAINSGKTTWQEVVAKALSENGLPPEVDSLPTDSEMKTIRAPAVRKN